MLTLKNNENIKPNSAQNSKTQPLTSCLAHNTPHSRTIGDQWSCCRNLLDVSSCASKEAISKAK